MMWRFGANDWDKMAEVMQKSGCGNWAGGSYLWQGHLILGVVTWVLLIAVLVALFRWLWKKGNK
ncbi:MAG: hypothetical protein Q7S60_04790 [bacterium]|nr:hypothetical protein [bacterium]